MKKAAVIVGAGSGISAAVARALHREGYRLALAARDTAKLSALAKEVDAEVATVDACEPDAVAQLFASLESAFATLDLVLYNASHRARGSLLDLDAAEVAKSLMVSAYGGFLVGQQAARRMVRQGFGAIFFTGASASVKGYAQSAPFAMGKFALRGLAQAMARELQPRGIHIAHFIIDGGVKNAARGRPGDGRDGLLEPEGIAETYLAVLRQPRSTWSLEIDLRPWVEPF
jgi:NAD(P)-dependent dehydrogenase (short-subunit alcohol dehydrogenase family)